MSDSIITISPKTSPYRSDISTRLVPLNNRNVDYHVNEKVELRKLNDQFLSYIERVRIFETYNNCLTIYCEQIKNAQERTKTKLDLLRKEFDEYQQEKFQREKNDFQLENENINQTEKQVEDFKNKQQFFQHEHDFHRKQITDLQKQTVDLQAKTEQLRFEYENLNDDNNHYRKHVTYYQLLKASIIDEITRQRDIHQRLQNEVDELKMQKQISVQAHEADTQAIEIHNDNMLYDLTTNFRFDGNGKNLLTKMLNEIREEYKIKDHDMREELHRKYLYEYNQHIKKQVNQNLVETNREDVERRHLSNELNSLNNNKLLLKQKLTLIQEHYKQLENNFQQEIQRQKDMKDKYENHIDNLRLSVQEYENLLRNSSLIRQPTIVDEVNKYRQLLEGSDKQIGLRQLINMSHPIDRFTPNYRPTTPPPPPSPSPLPPPTSISKSDSTSTLPVPSYTRQNSISENSFETAPISQSSTSTTTTNNQQYITLDSANDKLFHSDYDTDNDQSQTIQYMSGRSSRLMSETDTTPTVLTPVDQEVLPPLPPPEFSNHDETIVEIPIDTSHTDVPINQTLPFVPMTILAPIEADENKAIVSDEQQSPIISTLENREEVEKEVTEPIDLTPSNTIIPITIDVDTKPVEESNEVSSSTLTPTSTISVDEQSQLTATPILVSDQPEAEAIATGVPISALPVTNPLAKLISNMLPTATPFLPSSNGTSITTTTTTTILNRPVSPAPIPISTMNNDAPPFIPNQNQHSNTQQHMSNTNTGHWGGPNTRGGGGGNRRGQSGGSGYHHGGGGGNQRSGGGGNWQQSGGGGHHKQRRGQK